LENIIYNYFTVAASTDGDCEIDAQCSTPFQNSKCDGNKCKCLDTHVESTAKDKCLESNFPCNYSYSKVSLKINRMQS
jgi:hypothetical protein